MRIAACGHTSGQIAHCVQIVSSQIGISWAMLRFSHCVVPVGKVPSTGSADTGSRSPLPSSIIAVTRCTKSGAACGTTGRRVNARVGAAGHLDLAHRGQRGVDGGEVARQHGLAALAVGLADRLLDLRDRLVARQHAGDGEEAGLRHGVDAAGEAGLLRHRERVDDVERELLVEDLLLRLARQLVPHLVRPVGAVEQEGGAGPRERQHVELLHELELVAGDEVGAGRSGRTTRSASARSAGARR